MVSPQSAIPVYWQIADILRDRITAEQYVLLPTEAGLAAEFEVSRDAIRDALAVLSEEGLIDKRRGMRAQVRAAQPRQRVTLDADDIVTARMPTPKERAAWDVPRGVPMFFVGGQAFAADRTELAVPSAAPEPPGQQRPDAQ